MATTSSSEPSVLEKIDLIPSVVSVVGTAVYHVLTGPFRGSAGHHNYQQHVTHAILRKALLRLNTAQLQYVSGTFSQKYDEWCQQNKVTPNKVVLKTGTEAFWVGDPQADYVVVYYHGGGFSLDGGPEHLDFWGGDVYPDLKAAGKSVAFLFLQYTLVPHGTYPVQVKEAIESVRYLTEDLGRSPSTILLGGDSAGGNMCLAVISQALHPSPHLPNVHLDKPLKALLLVAPWVRFVDHPPGAERSLYKDIVSPELGAKWSADYLAGVASSPYAEPANADSSWWKDAPVEHVVCAIGADELLYESVTEWVQKYKSANGPDSITYVVGEHESHIAPIIEPRLGDRTPTAQGEGIKKWMKSRLGPKG